MQDKTQRYDLINMHFNHRFPSRLFMRKHASYEIVLIVIQLSGCIINNEKEMLI